MISESTRSKEIYVVSYSCSGSRAVRAGYQRETVHKIVKQHESGILKIIDMLRIPVNSEGRFEEPERIKPPYKL